MNMINAFSVILVFGGLIFFHELGHFLAARLFKMGVKTFSIGFGPVLFRKVAGRTQYQIAAIPLGGYVALVGETADAELPEPFTTSDSFSLRPAWQRFIVIFAGSFFNLVLAWLLCWGVMFMVGERVLDPVVGNVLPDTPAATADLRPGDRIVKINGAEISIWNQIQENVQAGNGTPLQVVVHRAGEHSLEILIHPIKKEQSSPTGESFSRWVIGIEPDGAGTAKELSFLTAAGRGFDIAVNMFRLTVQSVAGIFKNKIPASSVGGPIGIVQVIYKQADQGVADVILLAALISINLGMLNLLPVPVLDGGHLFFLLIEMVARRPVPEALQQKAMLAGIMLLLSLMLFATFNDIARFFE